MKKIVLLLIAIATIVAGCKKYNYNTTIKKICSHHLLETYTVNSIDSLSSYKDSLGTNFRFFYDEIEDKYYLRIEGERTDGKEAYVNCKWGLINNRKNLEIHDAFGFIGIGPFGHGKNSSWEILDLSKEEFKIKSIYNEKEYLIALK